MDYRGLGSIRAYPTLPVAGVAAAALLVFASPGAASEMCPIGAPGIAVCGAAPDLAEDLSRRRVNRTLATNPAESVSAVWTVPVHPVPASPSP